MTELGRLEKVELRDIWQSEAQDFTPWLAQEENLKLLGETLGIDLELEAIEQNVGPFRADILCKDTLSDRWVLIENQLERTDHTHLGQLITYAAGLDAVTIVWIAARVAEEHRAAVDWLNEITDSDVRFFLLEVELWRIENSVAAPKFNVASQPNDWQKTPIVTGRLTELKKQYLDYWTEFAALASSSEPSIRFSKPGSSQYIIVGVGSGVHCYCAIKSSEGTIRCGVEIQGDDVNAKYQFLKSINRQIEDELGFPLIWEEKPDRVRSSLFVVKTDTDPTDRDDWRSQHEWLLHHITKLKLVFQKHLPEIRDARNQRTDDR